jgi:hypothetical protein
MFKFNRAIYIFILCIGNPVEIEGMQPAQREINISDVYHVNCINVRHGYKQT